MGGLLLGSKLGTESTPCSREGEAVVLDETSDGGDVSFDTLDSTEGYHEAKTIR